MASSYISNAMQINFDSGLGIQDNDGMVNMFRTLEATGLRGFLGCSSVLYEQELEQFFDTALIQDGVVTCAVSGKYVEISARTLFSHYGKTVQFSCKKRLLKYEFRLLNDILAKSITVKAGSFDVVTHERFLMMTAIHFGIKVNWSKILFEVLKEMVDRTTRRAKGFATQICVLLKDDPVVTLGEAKTFPPLKIISEKMVNTYVATNKTIDARGEIDEPDVAAVAIVKKNFPGFAAGRGFDPAGGAPGGDFSAHISPVVDISSAPTDFVLSSPHQSSSSASSMHFTNDIPQGTATTVEQTIEHVTATATYINEHFALLQTSISENSIKQLPTQSKIGDLQNAIFSKIDTYEKAAAEARVEQDQSFRSIFKNLRQGAHTDTAALSIELHDFKKAVRAQNAILTTNLADLRKDVKNLKADLSKEFDDKLVVIRNDLLEFRVET
ncbi:hypothetical protein F511_25704 [Dorcoceras hygrometricum]|uniref:Dystroglycan-like n=1 Tax=Dorcoceras hygrometricum TaxID=472368 RepID=A0A2Z7AEC4_9LAMI|nr:hypothetical protein F511_25704 [Dorcoceras hygrometricum]